MLLTLAMTLRFYALGFIGGLVMAVTAGYSFHKHESIPSDYPFAPIIPFDLVFLGGVVVGVVAVLRALAKGHALAH